MDRAAADEATFSSSRTRPTSQYLDPAYWDSRFETEDNYEWLKDISHFRHLLLPLLLPSSSVLEIGCGSSRLAEEIHFSSQVADITCVDLSPIAVQRLQRRLSDRGIKGIKVQVADMLDLPFESERFDVVIEKGTMDVLFVDSGDPWNPEAASVSKVMKMLEGVHKVLKPQGIFISISFGQPHFRRKVLEAPGFTWCLEWDAFGDDFHYFFYTLKKGKRSPIRSEGSERKVSHAPSINLLHEELEAEDYLFRTAVEEL